jgi:hypothetical protein
MGQCKGIVRGNCDELGVNEYFSVAEIQLKWRGSVDFYGKKN